MPAGILGWAEAMARVAIDYSRGHDYGCATKFWQAAAGNMHIQDVQLFEPAHHTIEMRLVPGSDPPRFEPV